MILTPAATWRMASTPGMEVGAVAEVLEHVLGVGEGRLAYPGGTLTTHLGKGMGVPIGHPCRHVVAANAAQGVTALGHPGRRVMWAAGAEMGYPFDGIGGCGQGRLFLFYNCIRSWRAAAGEKTSYTSRDRQCHHGGRQFTKIGQQVCAVLIEFTDDLGS